MSKQPPFTLTAFSLHFQWTSLEKAVEYAAQAGFDAIAWSVRETGHIHPERVARELPRAVALAHDAGLATPEVVTGLRDASDPHFDAITGTLRDVGIPTYRGVSVKYDYERDILAQLEEQKRRLERLVEANRQRDLTAMLHTHSYLNTVGGSVWDLWSVIREFDPRYAGISFDIGHVVAKTGAGWREALGAASPYVKAVSTKDFVWARHRHAEAGEWPWYQQFVPVGEGMVDFGGIFRALHRAGFSGPVVPYLEFFADIPGQLVPVSLLGRALGAWTLEMAPERYLRFVKDNVDFHRKIFAEVAADD